MTATHVDELKPLRSLARAMGVHTRYTDGLGRRVIPTPETLVAVCAALGAPVERPADAVNALRAHRAARKQEFLPPVVIAWDGELPPLAIPANARAEVLLQSGEVRPLAAKGRLSLGYHRLMVEVPGRRDGCTVISAPHVAWRRSGSHRSWGVAAQLSALRSARSRSFGDLRDLETLCRWIHRLGGDLVAVLPLLPTFNTEPWEPSPYSPVSRLFWSELIIELGENHRPAAAPEMLDVAQAEAEVRHALAALPPPPPDQPDDELVRYARFRGAQARLGRNWREWPDAARAGTLATGQVDPEVERFHLVAQTLARRQLRDLRERLERDGMRVGLDLAVGVHPDGYDPWSRQHLFGEGCSVGAPPDRGFPSGQDWGFAPVLPEASRREGHRYLAASIAHQASLAGMLRVDHIMACTRLYWIPHGFGLHQGTYVSYPADELFAILTLESNLHRCEVVGENLGTVPREVDEALPRHRIWGMYLAEFEASERQVRPPDGTQMALVGTHDTPTFAGWIAGNDIAERVKYGLLGNEAVADVRKERARAVRRLATRLQSRVDEPHRFLAALLDWLGGSDSPLVVLWLEDLWLEERGVNLPGTPSSVRPNWQLPMRRLLDDVLADPQVEDLLRRLDRARKRSS
ncbi:MAG TPA: 4-alpha-glucanotransferase [Gemmatimonadales bacterium]|nr:4-alpha-glucanotransferase [Gemmatimonadales bacterium]